MGSKFKRSKVFQRFQKSFQEKKKKKARNMLLAVKKK